MFDVDGFVPSPASPRRCQNLIGIFLLRLDRGRWNQATLGAVPVRQRVTAPSASHWGVRCAASLTVLRDTPGLATCAGMCLKRCNA